ncbi:MAG: FG-GAP repeat protein [Verrucomicrobiae bacterium]|nr:FG-GAP repeat protein [Verrucomicrobiae bacterium]
MVTSSFVPPEPDPEPPPPPAFTNLMSFGGGIAHPPWCLAEGTDGLLYGVSIPLNPSSSDPTAIVKVDKNGANAATVLVANAAFSNQFGAPLIPQLVRTWEAVFEGTNDFYIFTNLLVAATRGGGTNDYSGAVLGVRQNGSDLRLLAPFHSGSLAADGFDPLRLTKDNVGGIVGATRQGGRPELVFGRGGVLFRVWPSFQTGHAVLNRYSLEMMDHRGEIVASDNRIYGVARSPLENFQSGYSAGRIFRADADGGFLETIFRFPPPPTVPPDNSPYPVRPFDGLVEHSNGFLYGAHGAGHGWRASPGLLHTNVHYYFRIAKDGSGFRVMNRLGEADAFKNQTPAPEAMVEGSDGWLYGFMIEAHNLLVALHPETGELKIAHDFGPTTGSGHGGHTHTTGALLKAGDGALYGTVLVGGEHGRGFLFRYMPPTNAPAALPAKFEPSDGDVPEEAEDQVVQQGGNIQDGVPGYAPASAITLGTNFPGGNVGRAVAMSTNWLVVGVPFGFDPDYQGTAHVFRRDGTNWNHEATLQPPGGDAVRFFGFSAALDGTNLVVGAPGYFDTNLFAGAAYVFTHTNDTWQQVAKLTGQNLGGDEFGDKVALHGNTLIVGAPGQTNNGPHTGAAWIF